MKLKLSDVRNAAAVIANKASGKFPIKLSYAFSKNNELLIKEYERTEAERIKLCETYADKDEDGNPIKDEKGVFKLSPENVKLLGDELAELFNEEVEIDVHTVPFSVLEKCDENDRYDILTVADITALKFMFEGDELQEP